MKLGNYEIMEGLLYTTEHEWARIEKGKQDIVIGISDYGAKLLNEIVYVDIAEKGTRVGRMQPVGTVESVKAISEIFAPISGVIVELNDKLEKTPELINTAPYGEGWLLRLAPSNVADESKMLMDHNAYASLLRASRTS